MEAPSSFGPLVFLNPTNRNMKLSLSYGPLQDKFQKKLMAVSDANCLGAFRKGAHFARPLVVPGRGIIAVTVDLIRHGPGVTGSQRLSACRFKNSKQ